MKLPRRRVIIFGIVVAITLIGSSISGLANSGAANLLASEHYASANPADLEPSVSFIQIGLVGGIETDILVAQLAEKKSVLLGTSKGLYVISEGDLQKYIPTSNSVSDIALLGDVTGNAQQEIVVAINDINFPNICCYDSATGDKIWYFAPRQEVFLDNLLWVKQQTLTFDIEVIDDVDGDGYQDVAATSGYCLYLLNGKTGEQIWKFETPNNLWRVTPIPDMDGDKVTDFALGAQNGFVYVISGREGELLWQSKVAEECIVFDDKGNKWATIDRSVWDIVPIKVYGEEKAVVSSEDGKVRLINLEDGTCDWETLPLIEYSSSLLYEYYSQKGGKPTSLWDAGFFNLRISLVEDVSGDGIEEILVSASVGQRGGGGAAVGGAGLFLINSASGEVMWGETGLDLENVARVETAHLDGKQVILVPQPKSDSTAEVEVVDIEDGQAIETLEIVSTPSSDTSEYWAKEYDEDSFILVSDYEDLLCVSSQGEVLWHYPRISDVAVEKGEFVGDGTPDLFIWSRYASRGGGEEFRARILYVIDGATWEKAWSYEMPYEELTNIEGIAGIRVSPDLNGDGKQDIIGYTQPSEEGGYSGEDYRILAFSGSDGSILLDQPVVAQTYYGIYEQLYQEPYPEIARQIAQPKLLENWEAGYRDWFEHQYLPERLNKEEQRLRAEGGHTEEEIQQLLWQFEQQERQNFEQNMLPQAKQEFEQNQLPGQVNNFINWLEGRREGERIDKRIYSLDVVRVPDIGEGIAFVVGCRSDIFLISPEGELLWTRTYQPWVYEDPFTHEQPEEMWWNDNWETYYHSLGDINGDGIDDLLACGYQGIFTRMSSLEQGKLDFETAQMIFQAKQGEGIDPRQVRLVDDVDGDGVMEVSFLRQRERQLPLWTIASTKSGETLFEMEWQGGSEQQSLDLACADFNGDTSLDHISFWKWREDSDRPGVEVISGKDGKPIWQFPEFKECSMFDAINLGKLIPAAPISDMNGDGIPDLALIKFLPDQPGARVAIYDVCHNELLKEIVIEKFDEKSRWERRWHPGALIEETGDFNGDGTRELALVVMLGETREEKEAHLLVVDVVNERVMADFQIVGSQLIEVGEHSELGVVGLTGEVYFLNVANNLRITSPTSEGSQTSPVRITWEGVSPGAFNRVFIDDIEVARTNENEVTLDVARGEHELTIRSLDEYGKEVYATVTFEVEKGSSAVILVFIVMVILILAATSPVMLRAIRRFRPKGINHGQQPND
jgi:outer membrane protein assembly factor BamB